MKRRGEHTEYSILAMKRMNEVVEEYGEGNQQRIVEKTGVNKGSISSYCNGNNIPSNITAKKNMRSIWTQSYMANGFF